MHAGVDEAGRGPVLGPLVVAAVRARPEELPEDVGDSKSLSASRRTRLAARIREGPAGVSVRVVTADELNERMGEGASLDAIETAAFAAALDALNPDEAVADPVGPDPDAFAADLEERLGSPCRVRAAPGADGRDPVVGAASIVAKVRRDRALERIGRRLDADVGSGYPSDPTTRAFLEDWRDRTPQPPPHARREWSTLEQLGFGQARLGEAGKPPAEGSP